MADNKKSVLLYCDLIHTVEKLTYTQAGKLFKHYLRYLNDLDPKSEDVIIDLVFEPIKQNLKRDLKKWEKTIEGRSIAGKASAEARRIKKEKEQNPTNPTSVKFVPQTSTNPTVKDTVTVTVKDTEINTYNKSGFLKDWNELRLKHLKKSSFLNTLRGEDLDNFNDLLKDYKQEQFTESLIGLFKQKKLPNDSTSMQSNPKHFLKFFNTYLTAYHDRNTNLYGKTDNDARTN